jgi:hypothetical protein
MGWPGAPVLVKQKGAAGAREALPQRATARAAGARGSTQHSLSGLPKRMQKSATSCLFSAKSTQDQTQALSLPACSCRLAVGITAGRAEGGGRVSRLLCFARFRKDSARRSGMQIQEWRQLCTCDCALLMPSRSAGFTG